MKTLETFGTYRIVQVWNCERSLDGQIIDLWRRNNILPSGALPEDRVKQVVVAALDSSDRVIGVNTVYRNSFSDPVAGGASVPAFIYRQFIQVGSRAPHLMKIMTNLAFDVLNSNRVETDPKCLVIIAENPGVGRPGLKKLLESYGYKYLTDNQKGQAIYRRNFTI